MVRKKNEYKNAPSVFMYLFLGKWIVKYPRRWHRAIVATTDSSFQQAMLKIHTPTLKIIIIIILKNSKIWFWSSVSKKIFLIKFNLIWADQMVDLCQMPTSCWLSSKSHSSRCGKKWIRQSNSQRSKKEKQ